MDATTQIRSIVALPNLVGKHDVFPDVIECQHPLATANGSVLCGGVAWDLFIDFFHSPESRAPRLELRLTGSLRTLVARAVQKYDLIQSSFSRRYLQAPE